MHIQVWELIGQSSCGFFAHCANNWDRRFFFYVPELRKINPIADLFNPEARQPAKAEKLKVDLSESGEWIGGSDSSIYSSTVAYTVSNQGNTTENNIEVEILVDGVAFKNFTVESLAPNNFLVDRFPVSVERDSAKRVSVVASCSGSKATDNTCYLCDSNQKIQQRISTALRNTR